MKVISVMGDDISTDVIYPGRYMATVLPTETPAFAFADNPELNPLLVNKQVPHNSVIIGGENFGCGSSREQAVSCLKGHELIIAAKSFARIFLQNAVNLGLITLTIPDVEGKVGDELEWTGDKLINKTSKKTYSIVPLSGTRQAVMEAGGLIPYTRQRLLS